MTAFRTLDDLGDIIDALVAQDQADRLAEFEAAQT